MMWLAGVLAAVAGTVVASYIDIRTKEIPNEITLGMIAAGLALCTVRIYYGLPWFVILPIAFAIFFIWLMWRAGLFGGGDAKLMMGIVLLIPVFSDGTSFIPTFFVMVAVVSSVHYFVFGMIEGARKREHKSAIFVLLPVAVGAAVYILTDFYLRFSSILAVFSFAVVADLMSPFLSCRRKVEVSEDIEGEMLAETVGLREGKVVREMETPSLLMKFFSPHEKMDEIIASPGYLGISKEEIKKLGDFCTHVYIFPSYPMAPLILAALLLSLVFGNVMG
ncbi:MAG: prepilin peptidase [Deltaproteobacteria bacterium]|nr:prepilin peptidase [Deltaproteobacteria bacterium]